MADNHIVSSAMRYIRGHLIRFLLLAVILTTGLTLRMAAFAKYSSYLNDFTSTVAGDFYFTSDYLYSPEDRTAGTADYQINSWKGEDYEVEIEIRNYENSLRFNHTGTDFFYWLEVAVYDDAACEKPSSGFNTYVTYSSVGATGTDSKEYGFMPGMSSFDHTAGMQVVKVKVSPISPITSGSRYMKVTAHTVPLTEVSSLTMAEGVSTSTSRGVYYATLEAVFALNITSTTANITHDLYAGTNTNYTVRYRVLCNSSDAGGGSVRVKVYYRSDRLEPDISNGNSYTDNSGDYAYTVATPWRYVMTTVNVGGPKDLYFYKTSLSLAISSDDFAAVVLKAEDMDNTEYDITTAAGVVGGTVSITDSEYNGITNATMGTKVYFTLTPDEGYMLDSYSVYDSLNEDLHVDPLGANRYSFEMTNKNVTITPTFVRKVVITVIPSDEDMTVHGTVTSDHEGVAEGQKVYLTVKPEDDYELSSLTLNGSNTGLTKETDTLYSFVMPDSAANVTASFTKMAEQTEEE